MFGRKKAVSDVKKKTTGKKAERKNNAPYGGAGLSLQSGGLFYTEVRATRSGYKVINATRIDATGAVEQDHIVNFNALDDKLKELTKTVKIDIPVCIGIPFRDFQFKMLEFPDMEQDEAVEALKTQFGSVFSGGLTPMTAQYEIFKLDVPSDMSRGGFAQYLAVASRKDVINRLQTGLTYIQMNTIAIEPGEIAMARALGDVADAGKIFWMAVRIAGNSIHMTTMYDDNPLQFRVTMLNGYGDERLQGLPDIVRSQIQLMDANGLKPERVVVCGDLNPDAVKEEIGSQVDAEIVTASVEDMWELDAGNLDLTGFECAMALAMR